jgi:hypothetical protein
MVCLRNICINTLQKGAKNDDNDYDNNNNNNINNFKVLMIFVKIGAGTFPNGLNEIRFPRVLCHRENEWLSKLCALCHGVHYL